MSQVMPQHEFLKETARKRQPLLSMIAEKNPSSINSKERKRKYSIQTVKSNYIIFVLTRNITNTSPSRFKIFPSEKNINLKKTPKILDLHKELPISSPHSFIRISSKLVQLLHYKKAGSRVFFLQQFF